MHWMGVATSPFPSIINCCLLLFLRRSFFASHSTVELRSSLMLFLSLARSYSQRFLFDALFFRPLKPLTHPLFSSESRKIRTLSHFFYSLCCFPLLPLPLQKSHSNGAGSGSSINDGHVTPSSGSVGAYDYVQVTSLATATPAARAQHSRPPSTHPLPSPPPQCVGSSYLAVSQHEPGQTITLPPILLPVARQQASSPTSSPTLPTPSGEGKRRTSTESEQQQQQIRRAAKRKAGSEDPADATEAARILEERRRRNASASARFRKRRNERERELVSRCMFLEHHLLQSLGSGPFDQLMRKAPAASAIEGPLLGRRALDLRDMMPGDELEANDADSTARNSPSAPSEQQRLSVCALTAPKNIDDVWAAYLALSQQVAGVVQRVQTLEERR